MGACNSAQAGLEQRCGRQIRRNRKERRTGSSSSSSSSNSSSSLTLANNKPSLDKSISSNAVGGEKLQQQQPSPERPPRGLVRDGERVKKGVDKEETVSKQQQDLRRKSSGSNHRISGNILGSKLEDDTKTTTHSEEGLKAKTEEEKNKRQERGGKEEIGEEKKRSKLDVLKGKWWSRTGSESERERAMGSSNPILFISVCFGSIQSKSLFSIRLHSLRYYPFSLSLSLFLTDFETLFNQLKVSHRKRSRNVSV